MCSGQAIPVKKWTNVISCFLDDSNPNCKNMGHILALEVTTMDLYWRVLTILGLGHFCVLCFILGFFVKVKLTVSSIYVCAFCLERQSPK